MHVQSPRVYLNTYVCLCAVLHAACIVLLEIMYAIWRCRDVVSPHVLVHLRETLLDVVLCAAFSHCRKSESLRGMVELREERQLTKLLPLQGLLKNIKY